MIKYLGSKRLLIPEILHQVAGFKQVKTVFDVFSGTARVGSALKHAGYRVIANDHNRYAHCLAQCYVAADREVYFEDAQRIIDELNTVQGRAGYITETFCIQSRYFQPHNGEKIDAIRDAITRKSLPPLLEAVVLTSLMEAADRVDSTTGVQMAYLKGWSARSHNPLALRVPNLAPRSPHGDCLALECNAEQAALEVEADLAYIDPPYNQHSYLGNYHVWETLVRGDQPEVYGIAKKRNDCKERKSTFNSKKTSHEAFRTLIQNMRSPILIVSFNDEGYFSRTEMETMLSARGRVHVIEKDFKRYVGAQIGIYNPQGQKVGKVSHLENHEYLFVVTT